jgi:hypothetical protein
MSFQLEDCELCSLCVCMLLIAGAFLLQPFLTPFTHPPPHAHSLHVLFHTISIATQHTGSRLEQAAAS